MRADLPLGGLGYVVVGAVAIGLAVAVLTVLPEALVAARRGPGSGGAPTVATFTVEAPLP